MRIVVDLGCMERNGADSLSVLAREYKPTVIFGFDPSPLLNVARNEVEGVPCMLRRWAAWIYDGECSFAETGVGSQIDVGSEAADVVECFDFSSWLKAFRDCTLIVKMDIEGAEVEVLQKMIADETDMLIDELLVEWHESGIELERQLRCQVSRWWM